MCSHSCLQSQLCDNDMPTSETDACGCTRTMNFKGKEEVSTSRSMFMF